MEYCNVFEDFPNPCHINYEIAVTIYSNKTWHLSYALKWRKITIYFKLPSLALSKPPIQSNIRNRQEHQRVGHYQQNAVHNSTAISFQEPRNKMTEKLKIIKILQTDPNTIVIQIYNNNKNFTSTVSYSSIGVVIIIEWRGTTKTFKREF